MFKVSAHAYLEGTYSSYFPKAQKVPGAKSSPAETPVNSNGANARNTQGTAAVSRSLTLVISANSTVAAE